nr:hypothetical protein CFP56_73911 [Quercus suber]
MNDEPSSSAAAASVHDGESHHPSATDFLERRREHRSRFNRKRGELLNDLLQSLDILVYAELSCIYYMEYARRLPHIKRAGD